MGRKKVYADDYARLEAYRTRKARLEITLDIELKNTIDEIATHLNSDSANVVRSLIKFALTNRNWKTSGLTHEKITK